MPTLGGITIEKKQQNSPKAPISKLTPGSVTTKGTSSGKDINLGGVSVTVNK
jgi:hypothetical protein